MSREEKEKANIVVIIRPPGAGRRFPYKPNSKSEIAEINEKIGLVLISVDNMIYKLIRQRLSFGDDDLVEEFAQKCRMWLWQKSMPKFDTWRGKCKVTTYLHKCIRTFVNQEIRSNIRSLNSRRHQTPMSPMELNGNLHVCIKNDRAVEHLASDVVDNPQKYLTKAQANAFVAIHSNPNLMMSEIAQMLGYRRASSLSMMLRRIKDRLKEIDIEEFAINYRPEAA